MTFPVAYHYADIRIAHVVCVVLSGTLFALRGVLRVREVSAANHIVLRIGSYVIDSMLLATAVSLACILHQYPFVNAWLTAKVLLLLVYIAFGSITLKSALAPPGRLAALAAALATFALIVGVAIAHDPLGWFAPLRS